MENIEKLNIDDYILVNDKYIGYIVKVIWNSNGYIIKLENDDNYIDKTLYQYKLLNNNDIKGYMLITLNDSIKKINLDKIEEIIIEFNENDSILKILKNINIKYNNLKKINKQKEINSNEINLDKIYKPENFIIYNFEAGQEDDYIKYITKMINDLFINNNIIKWEENFYIHENKSIEFLGLDNINEIIKPSLMTLLEKFDPIDKELYYNFKNTLMYKYLIYDDAIDTLSLGKELIIMIKNFLLNFQKKIIFDNEFNLLSSTNLFDYLNFKIVGGYVEISSNYNNKNFRVITKELIPNLNTLSFQYSKPIDYNFLSTILLKNKTPEDIIINKSTIEEALKILSQEYIICFQPKVEILMWTISRLIISWYSDPKLYENIFKIKILINLFRARGIKEFNKDQGIQPIIMIIPKYGKKNAIKVLSHLSYIFFPYKKLGWEESKPTWFDCLDNLMYYTNGSLELKKYINILLKSHEKINNPMSIDMTQVNNSTNNKIEYTKI